jgi:hypothetical protein
MSQNTMSHVKTELGLEVSAEEALSLASDEQGCVLTDPQKVNMD